MLQSEETKGKSAGKVVAATEEPQYLMNLNASITQCMAKAMEYLSDFTFVSMGNMTLVRQDSYLAHAKSCLKQNTLATLHADPLDSPTLFPVSVFRKAKEDISKFEDKGRLYTQSADWGDRHFYPTESRINKHRIRSPGKWLGNNWDISAKRKVVISRISIPHVQGTAII